MESTNNTYSKDFLELAHKSSLSHKEEILASDVCGCFYCGETYPPKEIEEWIEEKSSETAICPKCGIDSVLSSKHPINDRVFLDEMNSYWF
jgi:hypothetical protein